MNKHIDRWHTFGIQGQSAFLSIAVGVMMIWYPDVGSTGWIARHWGHEMVYGLAVVLILCGTAWHAMGQYKSHRPLMLAPVLGYFLLAGWAILDGAASPLSAVFLVYIAHTVLWGMFEWKI